MTEGTVLQVGEVPATDSVALIRSVKCEDVTLVLLDLLKDLCRLAHESLLE